MSEDTQELAFEAQIYMKADFGDFAVHCYNFTAIIYLGNVISGAVGAQDCDLYFNQAWIPKISRSVITDQKASALSNNLFCET